MKFSKCPLEYTFQAKKDRLGAGLACSKTKDVEVTKSNSCAVKGHFRGAGNAILPRWYPDQVAKDPSKNTWNVHHNLDLKVLQILINMF